MFFDRILLVSKKIFVFFLVTQHLSLAFWVRGTFANMKIVFN